MLKKNFLFFAVFMLAMISFGQSAMAEPSISGTVYNRSGQTLSGVTVRAVVNGHTFTTVSDSSGHYYLGLSGAGSGTVVVTANPGSQYSDTYTYYTGGQWEYHNFYIGPILE